MISPIWQVAKLINYSKMCIQIRVRKDPMARRSEWTVGVAVTGSALKACPWPGNARYFKPTFLEKGVPSCQSALTLTKAKAAVNFQVRLCCTQH